jgi:hypothetical protein
MKVEQFKKQYSYNSGDTKWLPTGGDLLKYIGGEVIRIHYTRKEDGTWMNSFATAHIIDIYDYNPATMTYTIKYYLSENEEGKEDKTEIEEIIIPEGFTFDIMGQGIQSTMNRFMPYSLHCAVVEEEKFFGRIDSLWDETKTLPFGAIKAISESSGKDQRQLLQYGKNIVAAVRETVQDEEDPDTYNDTGKLFLFRIGQLKLSHDYKENWRLMLYDTKGEQAINIVISETEEDYYEVPEIGDLKLIDLMGTGSINTESASIINLNN